MKEKKKESVSQEKSAPQLCTGSHPTSAPRLQTSKAFLSLSSQNVLSTWLSYLQCLERQHTSGFLPHQGDSSIYSLESGISWVQ